MFPLQNLARKELASTCQLDPQPRDPQEKEKLPKCWMTRSTVDNTVPPLSPALMKFEMDTVGHTICKINFDIIE